MKKLPFGLLAVLFLTACGTPTAAPTAQPAPPEPTAKQEVMVVTQVVTQLITVVTTATPEPASPTIQATEVPAATALPTEAPTALASPTSVPVLYEANWNDPNHGWALPEGWRVSDGKLIISGKGDSVWALAPYKPEVADYAIEADIEAIPESCVAGSFGIIARSAYKGGFSGCGALVISTVDLKGNKFAEQNFETVNMTMPEHRVYRFEVQGNTLTVKLNGAQVAQANENQFGDPGQVGIWCRDVQITVNSFKVFAL